MAKHEAWIAQARRDLEAAENLGQAGFYEQACFCYQQAIEKALKGLLLLKKNDFPKIHSLRELSNQAGVLANFENTMQSWTLTILPPGIWISADYRKTPTTSKHLKQESLLRRKQWS